MRETLDVVATGLMVAVAVSMLGFQVYDRAAERPVELKIEDWEEHNASGIRRGPLDARLVVTEFMDFTCPFCREVATVTDSLRRAFPNDVAIVFQHFPLKGRPQAMELAIAAECALEQGAFWSMYETIFQLRATNDAMDIESLAGVAKVPYLPAFEGCIARSQGSFGRIAKGRRLGENTGVVATPTIWLNGRVARARTFDEFVSEAQRLGIDLE